MANMSLKIHNRFTQKDKEKVLDRISSSVDRYRPAITDLMNMREHKLKTKSYINDVITILNSILKRPIIAELNGYEEYNRYSKTYKIVSRTYIANRKITLDFDNCSHDTYFKGEPIPDDKGYNPKLVISRAAFKRINISDFMSHKFHPMDKVRIPTTLVRGKGGDIDIDIYVESMDNGLGEQLPDYFETAVKAYLNKPGTNNMIELPRFMVKPLIKAGLFNMSFKDRHK